MSNKCIKLSRYEDETPNKAVYRTRLTQLLNVHPHLMLTWLDTTQYVNPFHNNKYVKYVHTQ